MVSEHTVNRPCQILRHSISLAPAIIQDLLMAAPDVVTVSVDYVLGKSGVFAAAAPITLWGGDTPTTIPIFDMPHEARPVLDTMISYPGISPLSHMPPMGLFGSSYPMETRLSVCFFRDMTMVGTSHLDDLLSDDDREDFSGRMGSVYAVLPESQHARLSALQALREKVTYHDQILRSVCGEEFVFTSSLQPPLFL